MIHGISGKSGGGKSYEAVVNHIIPIVTKDRRKVVTNIPLMVDYFCSVYGDYCRDLIEVVDGEFHNYGKQRPFSKLEHFTQYKDWKNEKNQGVYFFIDECHIPMPKVKCDKDLVDFISLARHSGYDIMLITQNFRKVNTDIKDNVVNHYRAIKKSMMGQDDKYILKVHDGSASSNASVVATHERTYEKKYFNFYKSHTDSDSAVEEATSNDIEKWYKHWSVKLSIVFFLFAAFLLSTILGSNKPITAKPKKDKTVKVSTVIQQPNKVQQPVVASSSPVVPIVKTPQQIEYEMMVINSKKFHPFHKISLSISGSSEYTDEGRRVTVFYFSASQNGQHVFTLKTKDLLMAGYDMKIFSDCAIRIKYYDFVDYLTCNAPKQGVLLGEGAIASN